jgi:hypothetical protein
MFEALAERLAGTLLMSADAAVEFATLGEFRLIAPEKAPDPAQTSSIPVTRPARSDVRIDRSLLPAPSTAHARATRSAPAAAAPVAAAPCAARRRPGAAEHAKRPAVRKRSGAVEAPVQLCLLND